MSLSTAEIEMLVRALAPRLVGGRVERIDEPARDRLVLHIRRGKDRYWLQFVVDARFSRLHLLSRRPKPTKPVSGLCNMLRLGVTKSPVLALTQVEGDRVVLMDLIKCDSMLKETPVRLVAELVGTGSNLILVDESGKVLACTRTEDSPRRRIVPGAQYQPLPAPPRPPSGKALVNRFADVAADPARADDALALSRAVESTYRDLEAAVEVDERRARLAAMVRGRSRTLKARTEKLTAELAQADDAETLRRRGELLTCVMHELRRGQESVLVQDFFDPQAPEITICLDPLLTPEQNVERCFRRYKKLKAGREHMQSRLREAESALERLAELGARVQEAADAEALAALEESAREQGLVRPEPAEKKTAQGQKAGPRSFTSRDGLEILVARSQTQNHVLTFSLARGNDYWMHLLGWAGPHVVVRKPSGKDVPLETLLDAAHLATYFSKLRGARRCEVVYTQRKHVHPVKGAGPGRVSYAHVSRLAVDIEQSRLDRLLDREALSPGRAAEDNRKSKIENRK